MQITVKSFGYGIILIEAVGYDIDGVKKVIDYTFPKVQEYIWELNEPDRVLIMIGEGHIPSEYEIRQLETEDWEWMRKVVNEKGSQEFSTRLTMLEDFRTVTRAPVALRT